jgi:neopullulanase
MCQLKRIIVQLIFRALCASLGVYSADAAHTQSPELRISAHAAHTKAFKKRAAQDEIIYFLLPDRFEKGGDTPAIRMTGERGTTGYDPTDSGFYHGGNLSGITKRLNYIQGLGATALWLAPVMKNKPVQGEGAHMSAGYHGYWILDFEHIDPHFGTDADFKALVAAAHKRGMKVYLDIVINHTADVIKYKECPHNDCTYRSTADYPSKAYTPYVPAGEEHAKSPAWLNDVRNYHNRGNSLWEGESLMLGDFAGLDDIATERPHVRAGFERIYCGWIERFGIDGFRVDTARHVEPEFWRRFLPAMQRCAARKGIKHFHIFGEIGGVELEPWKLAVHINTGEWDSLLDFAAQRAFIDTASGASGPQAIATWLEGDTLMPRAHGRLPASFPIFTSNHDNGRLGYFIKSANPNISDAELVQREKLGLALLLTLRGVPTLYYGDEQGFAGKGGDRDARQDMFPTLTPSYKAELGVASHFNPQHPLYMFIAQLAKLRRTHPALLHGRNRVLLASSKPGLLALEARAARSEQRQERLLLLFNNDTHPLKSKIAIDKRTSHITALYGICPSAIWAQGSVEVELPPLGFALCAMR